MKVVIDIPEIPTNDKQRWALANGTPYAHGKWLISSDRTRACCPFCHNKWTDAKEIALLDTAFRAKNFCEYCGADMRGDAE